MLLENYPVENDHYNKIADLICSEKIENIQQALELAQAMEYIDGYTYKEETHYDSRSHVWTFHEFDEGFISVLSDRLKENMLFGRGKGLRTKAWESGAEPNGVSASITLIETPPYE